MNNRKPYEKIILFNGKDLKNWVHVNGDPAHWEVDNGIMTVTEGDIMTKETFRDALIHIEFKVPYMPEETGQQRGNSGVYLQGRYEIQVLDSHGFDIPGKGDCGAFYDMHAPLNNACKKPEEWQSYDIIFRSPRTNEKGEIIEYARATVYQNEIIIHNNVELPSFTGNRRREGVDPDLEKPGPLYLQDHGGDKVSFRNIWLKHLPLSGSDEYEPK